MPGARPRIKPLSAGGSSGSSLDEVSQLELHLQRQLEEDIARIFDESIYSDLEVVCGKLKILTHSCILKARTHKFYHKLEAILHVNVGRNTFDEIYSFISDAYTECDIKYQENEIIRYLNEKLNLKPVAIVSDRRDKQDDWDVSDAYATPNCVSPEDNSLQKTLSSSPSTELTKEYYALVPIEGAQILDKELIEQDELSSAFNSFIQLRTEQLNNDQNTQCIKPTTLSLDSSHISKTNKHSIICDISKDLKDINTNSFLFENDKNKINNATSQVRKHISDKTTQIALKKCCYNGETSAVVGAESAYSPDSLITDELSSSSDYLSAAHSASPGGSHAATTGLRDRDLTKMNTFTVSDSGIDNNGMPESLNSHKDVTLNDLSLTESTFHDLLADENAAVHDAFDSIEKKQLPKTKLGNSQPSIASSYKPIAEMSGKSSKDEKQRQNEEIVILESSSLSSETGSWESVFPPKMPDKDLCEKFINMERQNCIEPIFKSKASAADLDAHICTDITQDVSYKSTSCFIDAASLADDEESQQEQTEPFTVNLNTTYRLQSLPMPCEPKHHILSPVDISESNDNDDSLEQPDPDSIQKDYSPTIFQMSLLAEESVVETLKENMLEDSMVTEQHTLMNHSSVTPVIDKKHDDSNATKSSLSQHVHMTSTPNNSIISFQTSALKTYESEGSDNDATIVKHTNTEFELPFTPKKHSNRYVEYNKKLDVISPIISGMMIFDDSLAHSTFTQQPEIIAGSFTPKRKIENIPIVSGAYLPPPEIKTEKLPKASSSASAWVIDMSKIPKQENPVTNKNNKKPGDKTCDILKASSKSSSNSDGCKSRSSVDSDSSEKSNHKFYIDLSTLPDALASEKVSANEANGEKKNIFSMFIDLGENSAAVKEMPARLSSFNTKKAFKVENKHTTSKTIKFNKRSTEVINGTDATFEKLESLCNSEQISISEILQSPIAKSIVHVKKECQTTEIHRKYPREDIAPTITEESDADQSCDIFVRLSDLDKTPTQKNNNVTVVTKSEFFERMTRSIPDNNWGEPNQSSPKFTDIISSFHSENALSLNRLFPHLKNDISRSMPGSLPGRTSAPLRLGVTSSPGERDELASDISEMSSVQSSMCRSVVENSTTDDTSHTSSLLINCQSRLGQDLLRMFMEEIAPDVIVEVSGRRIKAHKCILSSRCQYFAGILSGGWVESAGNVISLPPFSFSVVHFALCHIYSGISTIPDSISIVELATIADMLGLEGLKEAIMFTLKAKYCHHFHEPCNVCTVGVLECFPLTSVYGLDDLYRRCLRWITKHFRKVWPTKAFATLPSELLDKCYQELLLNLTTENLVETVYDCGLTAASLHRCRWAEVVARLCRQVAAAAAQFAGARLGQVTRALWAGREAAPPAAARALDECLAGAVERAPPDQLCRALALLHALHEEARDRSKPDLIAESAPHADRLAALRRRCEAALLRAAPRTLASPDFHDLPYELRRRLRDQRRKPRSHRPNSMHPDTERVRAVPVPPPPRHLSESTVPRVRSTKAQEERAKFNLTKTTASQPQDKLNGRSQKGRAPYGNAKPRYLEPRAASKEAVAPAVAVVVRKPLGKLVSSSESSRNSSPVLARGARAARVGGGALGGSRDSLQRPRTADPSTDSLSDSLNTNKYATYTKPRRLENTHVMQPKSQAIPNQPKKTKATKIPVLQNHTFTSNMRAAVCSANVRTRVACPAVQPRQRGSLMMATKSSSAKMVPKINKESSAIQTKYCGTNKHGRQARPQSPPPHAPAVPPLADIPVMERSGTFLKDEPTFGDITTNIDIDE